MPWYVLFSFLTFPAVVGVAVTMSLPLSKEFPGIGTVVASGLLWVLAAIQLKKSLIKATPEKWAKWWMLLAIVLPLVTLWIASLAQDPAISDFFRHHHKAVDSRQGSELPASAPSRHALSWSETKQLLALLQPRVVRFGIQLASSLPPLWWLLAFGIAIWRSK